MTPAVVKRARRIATGLGLVVLLPVALLSGVWFLDAPSTARIEGPDAVAEVTTIEPGGVRRSLLVRGERRASPVLLFLHEPFGWTTLPFASSTRELERDFVVAHFDQRGAGSADLDVDKGAKRMEDLVADLREVASGLASRFGGPVLLVSHGASALVAAKAVAEVPAAFRGLVLVSPILDPSFLLPAGEADAEGWSPEVARHVERLQRDVSASLTTKGLLTVVRDAGEYTWRHRVGFLLRLAAVAPELWRQMVATAKERPPVPTVPVFAFVGGKATVAPAPMQVEASKALGAGEAAVRVFAGSGYHPMLEEPAAFASALREVAASLPSPGR